MDDHALRLALQARRRGTLLRPYAGAGSVAAQRIALCKTLATITNLVSLPEDMEEGVKIPVFWRVISMREEIFLLRQIYADLLKQSTLTMFRPSVSESLSASVSEVDSLLTGVFPCLQESRTERRASSGLRFLDVLDRTHVQSDLPSLGLTWGVVQRDRSYLPIICLRLSRYLEILRDGLMCADDFPIHEIVQVFEPEADVGIGTRVRASPHQFEVISDRSDLVLCERRAPSNIWQLRPQDLSYSGVLPERIGIYL